MNRIKQLYDWLDNRTGVKDHLREALFEKVPGGSRWRYVWGSTLTFTLMIQFITGIFLWMGYSPSGQTAWESVYYLEQMSGGHFLRGLHHWTAQVMTVLLVLHLMQVVIDGAYKAPREINFWFGIILLQLVLGLSLTGYLLPWDQKGYWATKVATDILGSTPLIGEWLKQLVLGGSDYGHHTLTRFFALHAGVLPAAVIGLTVAHIYLFRRHGLTAKKPHQGDDEFFWPEQVLKDSVACLAVLVTILVLHFALGGAHLDPPADPSTPYPARPDWYFLFLFEFLKYFPGHWEVLGAIIIPGVVMTAIFLMPIIGKTEKGHRFNLGLLFGVLAIAGILTFMAVNADRNTLTYLNSKRQAQREAELVKEMAKGGIPPAGALALLQGPKLFSQHCASCHTYAGHDGLRNVDELVRVDYTVPRLLVRIAEDENSTVNKILDINKVELKAIDFGDQLSVPGSNEKVTVSVGSEPKNKMVPRLLEIIAKEKHLTVEQIKDYAQEKGASKIQYGDTILVPIHRDFSAPDLKGFASREWLKGFFDPEQFASKKYFGGTAHGVDGEMVDVVEKLAGKKDLGKVIAALSAEARLGSQKKIESRDKEIIMEGQGLMEAKPFSCTTCHSFQSSDYEKTDGPDLTGYGSREWMLKFLHNPAHVRFYPETNDRMPAFGKDEKLTRRQMERIVDWLRNE
jgi:quinol-cytochrome oxidoreductase complex cytochrome b subunit/mono/diheme cytochrome c family protein/LysM repeat protein